MSAEDRAYISRRIREEEEATTVTSATAREIHVAFAEEYRRRMHQDAGSIPLPIAA